jgi:hypothetical protein
MAAGAWATSYAHASMHKAPTSWKMSEQKASHPHTQSCSRVCANPSVAVILCFLQAAVCASNPTAKVCLKNSAK